eukprot:jgi/Mesvir1/13742/Mv11886-RA.1
MPVTSRPVQFRYLLAVDALTTVARALDTMLARAEAANRTACQVLGSAWNGTQMYQDMVRQSFIGTSGEISFTPGGNRVATLDVVSLTVPRVIVDDGVGGHTSALDLVNVRATTVARWNFTSNAVELRSPIVWRDGTVTPPSPPPRDGPPPTPPPPAPGGGDDDGDEQPAPPWIWPIIASAALLLILNTAWLRIRSRRKLAGWCLDEDELRRGTVRAFDQQAWV